MIHFETPLLSFPASRSLADREAEDTLAANLQALAQTQPQLAAELQTVRPDVNWIFARDGSLTCQDDSGLWWAGCSLPKRAGLAMLAKLEVTGVTGCMLSPGHAGEIAAALNRLKPTQAVIVIQPDLISLRVALTCEPFAKEIASHRLWFAWGEQWPAKLNHLLDEQTGLPLPERFIRTPALSEEIGASLISLAETVFIQHTSKRQTLVRDLLAQPERVSRDRTASRICVLARSQFRLWDDAGHFLTLASSTSGETARASDAASVRLDLDDPAQSSALGLAMAASQADALVTADLSRAQLPAVISTECAVISWITTPVIPTADPKFPRDGLLLADANWLPKARHLGWAENRVRVGHWPPAIANGFTPPPETASLALLVDTGSLDIPKGELELSSHHILWEMIREELLSDPFALGPDAFRYLDRRRQKLGVSDEGFAAGWFIERLLLPAYQQGLAKLIIDAGLPLRLHGKGWTDLPQFKAFANGPVTGREELNHAISSTSAIIYAWPYRYAHAIDQQGKPVLTPARHTASFLRDAKMILHHATQANRSPALHSPTKFVSRTTVLELLSD